MDQNKINRIKNLKNEVRELHPLLHTLFKKLPGISHVEYRQGPTEMGADFIITKKDTTLDDIEYIGCIVKIGQIKQDHQELNRQIEECELERTINGGTRKIFLSEIWIIANGNITHGAQEKIHHKYKNKNIKFIDLEKIVSLTDKFYPQYWSDINVQVGEYLRSLTSKTEDIVKNRSLINPSQKNIYVPQQLIATKRRASNIASPTRKQKRINAATLLDKESFVIVEAMMGAGKSTLAATLVNQYSNPNVFNTNKVLPILFTAVELEKDFSGDLSRARESITKEHQLEEHKGYIFFIDGLDELKLNNKERGEFLNQIYQSSKSMDNVKILVTSRTIDDPSVESEIEKNFTRFRLCSFTTKQVLTMVDSICQRPDIRGRLEKDLDKSHLFKVLPKTPISAILLAKLLSENVQEIPSTMTDLYSKYMELCLGRWDMDKGLQSQQEYDVISNVTISIAEFIMNHSLVEISKGDAKDIFLAYTKSRNLKIDSIEIFEKIIKKEEIFSFDKTKNTISFRHRTFAEFFFAQGIEKKNNLELSESVYDPYWVTTYFFYIGLKRDCPDILEAIGKIHFTDDRYRVSKVLNNGNFLLAAYLTPYETIKNSVIDSFNNAAEIYSKAAFRKEKTPLKSLPSIQLLCIFTQALCDTFGYEYFSEALQEIANDIYTTPGDVNDQKLAELFFINSVRAWIGKVDCYDTMLKNYGNLIPLPIQAGILHHSGDSGLSSSAVQKFVKKFKKNVRNNTSFQNSVLDLHEKSIEEMDKQITKLESKNQETEAQLEY